MIADLVLDVVFGFIGGLVAALPVINVDFSALASIGTYSCQFGSFIDFAAIGALVALIVGLELILWTVGVIVWVYKKIPFVG